MAKLVEVYRNDKQKLTRRQLPLVVDENITMVMDMNSMGFVYDNPSVRGKELDKFLEVYKTLSSQEVRQAFQVNCKELLSILSQMIPCVGCRRSVERLFYQLVKSGYPALDPLVITPDGILTIQEDHFGWPHLLCTLLHGHSSRLDQLIESQLRSKKSRRCILHSLDSQRVRTPWKEVWDIMRPHCREEVLLIDSGTLMNTLDNYLHRHRFCSDCRTKVLRAYWLLVEEPEPAREKGYIPALYAGIKRCLPDKHLHLPASTDYISGLVARVQPDIMGSGGERHAKTLEIAQGEVITCLGLCVYERLQRIQLRLKEEETTCQVLAAVAIEALSRKFQTAVDKKRGATKLDLLFKELAKEEMVKQQRKEQKKLKRKKRKERKAGIETRNDSESKELSDSECNHQSSPCLDNSTSEQIDAIEVDELDETKNCYCGEFDSNSKKTGVDLRSSGQQKIEENCTSIDKTESSLLSTKCQSCSSEQANLGRNSKWSYEHCQDCGYSSGNNNASSSPSSPDGSEVACCDDLCNYPDMCNRELEKESPKPGIFSCGAPKNQSNGRPMLSLQEMLEEGPSSDEDGFIPAEDVQEFQSKVDVTKKRQELRETLKMRFAQLCRSHKAKS